MLQVLINDLTAEAVLSFWMVPIGLFILYFYGTFRFNTPDYDIVKADGQALRTSTDVLMMSLAPPRFTTTRRRFRRYEVRYVFLLETTFLCFVFAWPLIKIVAKAMRWPDPGDGSPTFHAVVGLLLLTGVLSSFPGFRDFDSWLLRILHEAALIPGNARRLAENLFDAPFVPSPAIVTGVKSQLIMRDTIRVAEGKATGSLETTVLRMLCLKDGLKKALQPETTVSFQVKMERDIHDIERATRVMVEDVRRYLRDQAILISDDVPDIDEAVEALDRTTNDLGLRRRELSARCEGLIFRMCLLSALLTNVSTDTPDQASAILRSIGFSVELKLIPMWDAEALMKVVGGTFICVLLYNLIAMYLLDLLVPPASGLPSPTRDTAFAFSLINTCLYGGVIVIARGRKRAWAREDQAAPNSPNLTVALYSYAFVVGTVAVIGIVVSAIVPLPGSPDWLFQLRMALSQLQFGVAGWFAAIYIDREGRGEGPSWTLVGRQAVWQLVAGFIGCCFIAADPPGPQIVTAQQDALWLMIAFQSAIAGGVLSYLTQRMNSVRSGQVNSAPAQGGSLIGDITVMPIGTDGRARPSPQGAS